jgi:hypothetical protein
MGVELPADLVHDYDMLQLLDEDSSAASSPLAPPGSPVSSLEKELLADCPLDDDTSSSSSSCPSPKLEDLAGFLLQDELFLASMEQSADDAIRLETLPDLDVMLPLSPAAKSWLDAIQDSPCRTDDEAESPRLQQGQSTMTMSPLTLLHRNSSPSDDSLGHTDERVAGSPRPAVDEMELLKREAKYLTAQKEFLEYKDESSRPRRKRVKARKRARDVADELKLLLKSQEANQLLNGLAVQQKMFADNFKAMLSFAPVNDVVRRRYNMLLLRKRLSDALLFIVRSVCH